MDLLNFASHMGVRVHEVHGLDRWGRYHHPARRITLRSGMGAVQGRSTLAHELGHAHYGHDADCPKLERQADAYAVWLLISPQAWEEATRVHSSPVAVANELGVLPRLVEAAADLYSHHRIRSLAP